MDSRLPYDGSDRRIETTPSSTSIKYTANSSQSVKTFILSQDAIPGTKTTTSSDIINPQTPKSVSTNSVPFVPTSPSLTSENKAFSATTTRDSDSVAERLLWRGTSVEQDPKQLLALKDADFKYLVNQRQHHENAIKLHPYDPYHWFALACVYGKLCYPELVATVSYRVIILVNVALGSGFVIGLPKSEESVINLKRNVLRSVEHRLKAQVLEFDEFIDEAVHHDLLAHLRQAWLALLYHLENCNSSAEALELIPTAKAMFPDETELDELEDSLKQSLNTWVADIKKSQYTNEKTQNISRVGKIVPRMYPWMSDELFLRSPTLLEEINEEFKSASTNYCKVRPLMSASSIDVGPLGVFAARNISTGTTIMLDSNHISVPERPVTFENCETCHVFLIHSTSQSSATSDSVVFSECCSKAAYCSQACHDKASQPGGFHTLLCGKDFSWLYNQSNIHRGANCEGVSWNSLVLLRVFANIVAEQKLARSQFVSESEHDEGKIAVSLEMEARPNSALAQHPLKHKILSRLAGSYPSVHSLGKNIICSDWTYFTHVVAPLGILSELGVDIWTDPFWVDAGETAHISLQRVGNNGCITTSAILVPDTELTDPNIGAGSKSIPDDANSSDKATRIISNVTTSGIYQNFIFFNHGCKPNVAWSMAWHTERPSSSIPNITPLKKTKRQRRNANKKASKVAKIEKLPGTDTGNIEYQIKGMEVGDPEDLLFRSSMMKCTATRDIKKGEECRIAYISSENIREAGLLHWFPDGCGCGDCEKK